jgi:hypothetical protein
MQMAEPMSTWSEVWPVAADEAGIWLLTGDRLITESPVMSDSDPWDEAKLLLAAIGVTDPGALKYLHGTSCRPDRGKWVVTHVAVVETDGPALADWPFALPLTPELMDHVGKPLPHGPTSAPIPRDVDVAYHAAGHLADLLARNSEFRALVYGEVGTPPTPAGPHWHQHLSVLEPKLAQMYRTDWDTLGRIA